MTKSSNRSDNASSPPGLQAGLRMSQSEFHKAYDEMPYSYRAELIAGVVREPSPVGYEHSMTHPRLTTIIDFYAIRTPGVEVADNGTVILSDKDEVQPDVILRILPDKGGRCRNVKIPSRKLDSAVSYMSGAPELVAEVAQSSRDLDLRLKKERYAVAGVLEYIVVCLRPKRLCWFNLQENRELEADAKGVFRSEVFPGLWIHDDALLRRDGELSLKTLEKGLKSKEHKHFVLKLAASTASNI